MGYNSIKHAELSFLFSPNPTTIVSKHARFDENHGNHQPDYQVMGRTQTDGNNDYYRTFAIFVKWVPNWDRHIISEKFDIQREYNLLSYYLTVRKKISDLHTFILLLLMLFSKTYKQ